ncbi:DUF4382 domain-containing protein [Parapedobacter sp. DT-150]|uniref:DUF4382 domain-containing protein n=1 Tax=Parapedobacter sp. DT-150 TaxID=3396162 RepID=UPI003F1CC6A9
MMKKRHVLPLLAWACAIGFFGACSKSGSVDNGSAKLDLRLTDAPGAFDALYLDIQAVEFHTNEVGWTTVEAVVPGVYDLLTLRNGVDTLIARATLPAGVLSQVRFVLGEDNSIVVDGTEYPLEVPSGEQSGLKFNVHQELIPDGSYTIWADVDAARSIVETGNGSYMLKPVVRVFTELTNGRIRGIVEPMSANPVIYAISETDTASAIPNAEGFFLLSGLTEGDYTVIAEPDSTAGLAADTIPDVPVRFGIISDLGTITLTANTGE